MIGQSRFLQELGDPPRWGREPQDGGRSLSGSPEPPPDLPASPHLPVRPPAHPSFLSSFPSSPDASGRLFLSAPCCVPAPHQALLSPLLSYLSHVSSPSPRSLFWGCQAQSVLLPPACLLPELQQTLPNCLSKQTFTDALA